MSTRAINIPAVRRSALGSIALIVLFANFIALSARISLPLPFSPVPVTGETLAVLLAGLALGPRRGVTSVLVFIAEGAAGLPVFAGGTGGLVVLLGPTGGYLWGFVLGAGIAGLLTGGGRGQRGTTLLLALALGNLAIYCVGALWLSVLVPGGLQTAFLVGVLPFLPGDAIKCVIAAGVLPSAARFADRLSARLDDAL